MDIEIFSPADYLTTSWAGGTTTQLFIYPPGSEYAKRDFGFRLSTATVQAENSVFTSLPGISRALMVLDGEITIHHKGHYSKKLGKFATDTFDGGWETFSEGRCTDFNLMTTGNFTGTLSHITQGSIIDKGEQLVFPIPRNNKFVFFYIYTGEVSMVFNNITHNLKKGFLLKSEGPGPASIAIRATAYSEIVMVTVK